MVLAIATKVRAMAPITRKSIPVKALGRKGRVVVRDLFPDRLSLDHFPSDQNNSHAEAQRHCQQKSPRHGVVM
ncbi:hypothetical protein RSO01_82170 [Reyranella soli]|uniref:Uncharacterized protein n=1 Tax=Reyranella soli TaxID=1230389 RepID=A0A512NQ31_9HYPH|nr:hypothetical protein RSO01_82170 [Reyranella soli]